MKAHVSQTDARYDPTLFALCAARRTMEELTTRRQEELSKAVHDEVLSREHHMTRFAKATWGLRRFHAC